jgi:hypothetical protein
MHKNPNEDPIKEKVIAALESYKNNPYGGAGYDVMRYAQQGRIGTDVGGQVFIDWYPLHQGYVILRLAKAGKLYYKEKT